MLTRCGNVHSHSTIVCDQGRCCELLAIRSFAASWLFSPRRKALILLEYCTACPALPNVELTGPLRRGGLAREQKMYCVPAPGPRRPAVEGPVECRVRPRWRVDEAPTFLPGANAGYPTGRDRRREVFSCLMSMGGEECTQTHFSLPR